MNVALYKKVLIALVVLGTSGVVVGVSPQLAGQDTKKAEKTEKAPKKAKGRLPAYYADLVTGEQREKIYSIQAKHQEKIAELNAALLAATQAMNAEIESVLTPEQMDKLMAAQAEAAAKKKKNAAEKKAAADAKQAAAETKAK